MEEENEVVATGPRPWYFTNTCIALSFLILYPFMLPLVWLNPYYRSSTKVTLTFVILLVSAVLCKLALINGGVS